MVFRPTIIAATPNQKLIWLGHLILPGLFDGRHELRIEDRGGNCRFYQSEQFSGILVPLFGTKLFNATKLAFEAMNAALKQKAEA